MGRKIPLSEWLQTVGQNEVNNYAELVGAVGVLKWLEFSFCFRLILWKLYFA